MSHITVVGFLAVVGVVILSGIVAVFSLAWAVSKGGDGE